MRILLITVLFVFPAFPLLSQQEGVNTNEDNLAAYEDLFSAEEPLQVTLKFDVNAFLKTRQKDVYHSAKMTYVVNDDKQVSQLAQIKARETIRQKICALPPMWLKIGNPGILADSMQDAFAMNMVLPCKDAAQYEPYVLREYLAYKIYNIITPLSYRVRLVRLSIIDTGKANEVSEAWAFLQEPDELMARRLNTVMTENDNLSIVSVNPEVMNRLSMFQFMIGNPDYSVTGRHNLNIMTSKEDGLAGFIPVPIDFDYSGLVNTDYAIPSEALGISSVRDRYYLGPCRPEEVHKASMEDLAQFEDEIMTYVRDFEFLDNEEKVDMMDYLDSYFKESMEPSFIDRKISPSCR
jgi:hypothetical protein